MDLLIETKIAEDGYKRSRSNQVTLKTVVLPMKVSVGRSVADFMTAKDAEIGSRRLAKARKNVAAALTENSPPNLKMFRLASGLSQEGLAEVLGTKQPYVQRLETGKIKDPGIRRLRQLSNVLDVSLEKIAECF